MRAVDDSDVTVTIVGFARTLRAAGVDASAERVHAMVTATSHLDVSKSLDVYWAGRLTLCSCEEDLPPILGDPDKVRQVLTNFVDNAIKYSPDGGVVQLRIERRDHAVRFIVVDSGLGVPLSEQRRIFDKFYRVDPNLTRGVGGTGLGLYISRELVRRMNGTISVESREGDGSSFSFELPVATA